MVLRIEIGDKVLYKNKEYVILYLYDSNYCELREEGSYRTILVHTNDIELIDSEQNLLG